MALRFAQLRHLTHMLRKIVYKKKATGSGVPEDVMD
jgi:hypothetical protein